VAKYRKRREKIFYKYQCSLTGKEYKLESKAENPDDLISVAAYYELNPEFDDRPEVEKVKAKKQQELEEQQEAEAAMFAELAGESTDS